MRRFNSVHADGTDPGSDRRPATVVERRGERGDFRRRDAQAGETPRRDFAWPPLVVRAHGRVTDYCGLVSGTTSSANTPSPTRRPSSVTIMRNSTFDRRGTLSIVNVLAVGKSRSAHIPTRVDSICLQDGYDIRQSPMRFPAAARCVAGRRRASRPPGRRGSWPRRWPRRHAPSPERTSPSKSGGETSKPKR